MRTRIALVASLGVLSLFLGALVLPGGSTPVAQPMRAQLLAATNTAQTADGGGYWLVTSDGRVFAFGGAQLYGSMAGKHLKAPIIGIVATPHNRGYWLVGADGGVFSFGDAAFAGSLSSKPLGAPIVGMASNVGDHAQGPAGPAGPAGARGAAGRNGDTGATGGRGTPGTNGSNGLAGSNGTNGPTGATGSNGSNGATGPTGSTGSNGSNGSNGATGPTGAAGSSGLQAYGYVVNSGAQTVAIEGSIAFDTNGVLSGITHAPGNAGIVVTGAGAYRISFIISGVEPSQFAVFVNGAQALNTVYGSGAGTQQDAGQAILTLAAGDVITIVNHSSSSAVTLQFLAGGTQTNVNASVTLEKIA